MTTIGPASGASFPFQIQNAPPPPPTRKSGSDQDGDDGTGAGGVKRASQPDPAASGRKVDIQA
ncbi:MAG: hypothetical protein BGO51_10350 [Rhodospirillales bacterium 69-11]|nr:hypothetical protein [Rhodospirillales bacterium]MBN8927913.1 hypothetical protein [Rhodospirillales bacterium]OJW33207.1 MAG: hypothetical protein BGO51_10350 [Rhodospirillales bacterium 69-11]